MYLYVSVCNIYPSAATIPHIEPTGYHYVITATTAILKTPLESRAQPVATEHAAPSSTQFSTLSFVIGMCKDLRLPLVAYTISPKRATMGSELHLLQFVKAGTLTF